MRLRITFEMDYKQQKLEKCELIEWGEFKMQGKIKFPQETNTQLLTTYVHENLPQQSPSTIVIFGNCLEKMETRLYDPVEQGSQPFSGRTPFASH